MTAHRFGGGWTQIKLDVLEKYLSAYVTALKNKQFELLYIDAFAGTGEVTTKSGSGEPIDGSAKIALGTSGDESARRLSRSFLPRLLAFFLIFACIFQASRYT
jgi:three-Cys-motif partner protein